MLCIDIIILVVAIAVPPPLPSCPLPPSILISPVPVCIAVLGANDGNNNCIPSLIILSRKLSVHLQNSRTYPSADAKEEGGCGNRCNRLDSMLTAATTMMTMTFVEDGETRLVHSCGSGMICWVHSPSLPGCRCHCPPAATSQQRQQGGGRRNDNCLCHWHFTSECC